MENALILIVEAEPNIAEILEPYFQREGFRTVRAGDGETAILHHPKSFVPMAERTYSSHRRPAHF
ncbi:MAG: hypothetical protein RL145_1084 [Pseudomonadota bacterium]|jgi:CheY-like chemotaxis protein